MQKKSFSWGIIVLMFFLFFPVGIYMLVKKVTREKFKYAQNGKSLKTLGWVLLSLGAIYLIMAITEETTMISAAFVFAGLGGLSLYKGSEYIKKGAKFNRYVAIVNSSSDTYIDNIAAVYTTSYEQAATDLQEMIDAGYFMNSYIDINRRELVMPKKAASTNINQNVPINTVNEKSRTIKCPNCGATNTIVPGLKNECEYCGSPL